MESWSGAGALFIAVTLLFLGYIDGPAHFVTEYEPYSAPSCYYQSSLQDCL
jgi:hypothetical protein